ncbi:MAG TPA: S8 family serine peptidase, partial [Mucilaginibacter sp.]|nr:S8 family serine peptidase [Mucilaginibacter sp.]
GPGIDTVIVSEGVPGGTQPQPKTVGESYSLNFLSQIPKHTWETSKPNKGAAASIDPNKETVTIAVLDTGLDYTLVNPAYVCDKFTPKANMPCFSDVEKGGWNFLNNGPDFTDDNNGRHGSLVSQYIINQFKDSPRGVKIMPLKTHDANGGGDLFSITCAIHFAIAKGANIINASWGFYYYYDDNFLPYFKNLIGNELQQKGILFVTAAGNKIESDDKLAERIWQNQGHASLTRTDLRDVGIHKFFPAHLSAETNNIVTVTTTDVDIHDVSDQQNHSDIYVDLGIKADVDKNAKGEDDPSFEVPFELIPGAPTAYVAGSSFATAIATGHIGANNDTAKYKPGLRKGDFINPIPIPTPGLSPLIEHLNVRNLIRNGTCVEDYVKP